MLCFLINLFKATGGNKKEDAKLFALFSLSLFGYQRLSSFIFDRFIGSALVIGIFLILRRAVSEILHRVLFLRFWARTFKMQWASTPK